jgi:cell division protein FtsX
MLGALLGVAIGHGIVALSSEYIRVETGLRFTSAYVSQADIYVLPAVLVLGLVAGLLPSIQAYRLGVLRNLAPIS